MREIGSGSTGAFEELYDRYSGRAYRLAWSICRNEGRAEEAVQDAFASLWRSRASYRAERGSVGNWLLGVVRFRAIDAWRREDRHASIRAPVERIESLDTPGVMADRVVELDEAGRLSTRLAQLPHAQQDVIRLAFYGELTHAEIARGLRLPAGTVKSRIRLGLQKLEGDIRQGAASERWHAALAQSLYNGDLEGARSIVREARENMPAVSMLDDVFGPAMHAVGDSWERAEITIADEHRASAVCRALFAEISPALKIAAANSRERILLTSPAAEQHTLGLRMAGDVLAGAGYHTILLESGLGAKECEEALRRHRPAIVALSSTITSHRALSAVVSMVLDRLPAAHVIAGGAGARRLAPNARVHTVGRLDGLLDAVDRIHPAG